VHIFVASFVRAMNILRIKIGKYLMQKYVNFSNMPIIDLLSLEVFVYAYFFNEQIIKKNRCLLL